VEFDPLARVPLEGQVDVRQVLNRAFFGGGSTCFGFSSASMNSLALASASALTAFGTVGLGGRGGE
jgi:hypothetical protein